MAKPLNLNKMTAVEFLEQELDKNFEIRGNSFLFDKILKQAKEMDKEQKIQFANEYSHAVMGGCLLTPTEFYNETFK